MDSVPTSREFLASFLSTEVEVSPWVSRNLKKEKFSDIEIDDDKFNHDTNCIKAAYNHINMYDNPWNASISQNSEDHEEDMDECPEEETSDEENDTEIGFDQTRIDLMTKSRPPLTCFPENFQQLNDDFKRLIQSHKEELFSKIHYQDQVYYVLSLTDGKKHRQIGKLFGIHPATVYTHSKRMMKIKKKVGAPAQLTNAEIEEVKEFIYLRYQEENIPTIHSVLHFVYERFNKLLISDSFVKLLKRLDIAQTAIATPIDSDRAAVLLDDIKEYYARLSAFLTYYKVRDSFVINTDETGFQQWANAKPEYVLIPCDASTKDIHYSVKRQQKHSTLVASVIADGSCLNSLLIITRKTIERELYMLGYRPDTGYFYAQQENGFITAHIWDYWADEILFPEVIQRRNKYNYSGPILLLLDGCSAHFSEYFLQECLYYGIAIFIEPPNSSDQLQVLDLGLFGIQKKGKSKVHIKKGLNEQSEELIKIINSWEAATSRTNICSAFEQAGFSKYVDNDIIYMNVNIQNAIRIRGLRTSPVIHGSEYKDRIKVKSFSNEESDE